MKIVALLYSDYHRACYFFINSTACSGKLALMHLLHTEYFSGVLGSNSWGGELEHTKSCTFLTEEILCV